MERGQESRAKEREERGGEERERNRGPQSVGQEVREVSEG